MYSLFGMAVPRGVLVGFFLLTQKGVSAQWSKCAPTCEGVVSEGTNVEDPSDCRNFYTCVRENGQGDFVPSMQQQCQDGYYFNKTLSTNICVPIPASHEGICQGYCNPCETHCTEVGALRPHPTDCTQYYVCLEDDASVPTTCPDPGMKYFDFVQESCSADPTKCFSYCDECKGYCLEQGLMEDPADCHSYYLCDPPNASHFRCPDGYVYDQSAEDCVVGDCEALPQC